MSRYVARITVTNESSTVSQIPTFRLTMGLLLEKRIAFISSKRMTRTLSLLAFVQFSICILYNSVDIFPPRVPRSDVSRKQCGSFTLMPTNYRFPLLLSNLIETLDSEVRFSSKRSRPVLRSEFIGLVVPLRLGSGLVYAEFGLSGECREFCLVCPSTCSVSGDPTTNG